MDVIDINIEEENVDKRHRDRHKNVSSWHFTLQCWHFYHFKTLIVKSWKLPKKKAFIVIVNVTVLLSSSRSWR